MSEFLIFLAVSIAILFSSCGRQTEKARLADDGELVIITEAETTTTTTINTTGTTTETKASSQTSTKVETTTVTTSADIVATTTRMTETTKQNGTTSTTSTTAVTTTKVETTTDLKPPEFSEINFEGKVTPTELADFDFAEELTAPQLSEIENWDPWEEITAPDLSEGTGNEDTGGTILAEKSLYSYASSGNTWYNICHSLDELQGYVIAPGAEFNWQDVMGSSGADRGYKESTVYVGQKVSKGYGGGVCFTSTLLYQVADMANLQINEHHDHSLPVKYAERGNEAAVSYGSKNNRFTNTSGHTLVICTSYDSANYTGYIALVMAD